jgi:uncharacterized protein (DUF302 family)
MEIKYEVITLKPFDQAVKAVEEALAIVQFGVLWKLNFKDKLQEKGLTFDKDFIIMEVCNPHKAKEVLEKHIDLGYFLPCKVVVYESDAVVKIGFLNPKSLIQLAGYEDLNDIANEVEATLRKAIDLARV